MAKRDDLPEKFKEQYKDGDDYIFMDMESYDQVYLSSDVLGDAIKYPDSSS